MSLFEQSISIRSFIGAKNFEESRKFYGELGFEESPIGPKMSYYKIREGIGFYLQDYYTKDWVNNTMVFLEVADLSVFSEALFAKRLDEKYSSVKISDIKKDSWGEEIFMHDPAGNLWHFGMFYPES